MSDADQPTTDMPVVGEPSFEAPLPGADVARCPACLSPVRADQRYCLECGERLLADEIPPPPGGGSAFSSRSTSLLAIAALILIVVGVGLAWVALREPTSGGDSTETAITTTTTPTDTGVTDTTITDTGITDTTITDTGITDTTITDTGMTDTGSSAGGWPAGQTGWAVILASKSQSEFQESDAQLIADEAATAGVQQTGVLDSSLFPSLNPGYWAVFSGPYATKDEAESAAATIQGQGYPDAYARQVQP
jgi:hypothetical protein